MEAIADEVENPRLLIGTKSRNSATLQLHGFIDQLLATITEMLSKLPPTVSSADPLNRLRLSLLKCSSAWFRLHSRVCELAIDSRPKTNLSQFHRHPLYALLWTSAAQTFSAAVNPSNDVNDLCEASCDALVSLCQSISLEARCVERNSNDPYHDEDDEIGRHRDNDGAPLQAPMWRQHNEVTLSFNANLLQFVPLFGESLSPFFCAVPTSLT